MSSDLSVRVQLAAAANQASMHVRVFRVGRRQNGPKLTEHHDRSESVKRSAAAVTCEKRGVMNTLSSRNDLFSSYEDIKGVAILTVVC